VGVVAWVCNASMAGKSENMNVERLNHDVIEAIFFNALPYVPSTWPTNAPWATYLCLRGTLADAEGGVVVCCPTAKVFSCS
jgi:hypothetical protein